MTADSPRPEPATDSAAVFRLDDRVILLPVIHGSGDFTIEVRRFLLNHGCDCLAIPLPESFREPVEQAIEQLPQASIVIQPEWPSHFPAGDDDDASTIASYVPIDPCQPVIAAIRFGLSERIPRRWIDLETASYEPLSAVLPDPYALKQARWDQFAAAILPAIPRPTSSQQEARVTHLAAELRALSGEFRQVVGFCSLLDWPWIREAYQQQRELTVAHDDVQPAIHYSLDPRDLMFLFEELPYVTGLYERARAELESDEQLSVDGVKEMLLVARDRYRRELGQRARRISPKVLRSYLQYVRNLSLIEHRLTPSLYTLVIAAQQTFGDYFAIELTKVAAEYLPGVVPKLPVLRMAMHRGRLPDGGLLELRNRLPGAAMEWRTLKLNPLPPRPDQQRWRHAWNPFRQCSWPLEDVAIEKFRTRVKDAALTMLGHDLARVEKFSTSLKDGLDIRETLRNWHTGDLYVKVQPPNVGSLDCVVMLFDSPADPRDYPWRVTWHAEHHDESTLALFATNFADQMVGPGIGLATYGGAMFLFPPRSIPDIWIDPRLDFAETLEERLISAACLHAKERHVAILSWLPPGAGWKQLARRFGKKLLHVPLGRFSQETLAQLRLFHVLNGTQVRSYAAHFIRKA